MTTTASVGRRSFVKSAAAGGVAALVATAQETAARSAIVQKEPPITTAQDWLSLTEEAALEPQLPIIDPHHHFWDWNSTPRDANDRLLSRYLLKELAADIKGHNVRQTVFIQCGSMYRADGPEEFRVVGETEFVQGIAAESASGRYGDLRAAAGIVGTADLRLGERVAPVLEAQIAASPQRFRGIRHSAAWAEPSVYPNQRPDMQPHLLLDPNFRRGFAYLRLYGLTFEGWLLHPQIEELTDLASAFPETTIIRLVR